MNYLTKEEAEIQEKEIWNIQDLFAALKKVFSVLILLSDLNSLNHIEITSYINNRYDALYFYIYFKGSFNSNKK